LHEKRIGRDSQGDAILQVTLTKDDILASAETKETFDCTNEQFFKVIADYEKYPEFLSEVKQCKIMKTDGSRKLIEFHVSVIKSFSYRMWITEEPNRRIHWTLESGDLFKTSTGSWDLTDKNGKTEAVYKVEATFKIFVPGPMAKALVSVNLPNMMNAYRKRVKELYG
jgi:ribosome-associated toxin RatA of RatAB toxin-antitoxin module